MEKVKEDFLANSTSKSVEELWTSFKSSVNEGLSRFVPCKKDWLKEKSSLDHAKHQTVDPQKGFSLPKAQKVIKTERHETLYHHTAYDKAKIKQAYDRYLEDLLGISKPGLNTSPTGEAGQSKFEVKKLFSFLKNSRQDNEGIGPLRDPHTNTVYTSNTDKANLINNHLQSVFIPVSPLRLNHLSESAVLDGLADGTPNEENIPGTFRPKVPEMPQIASH